VEALEQGADPLGDVAQMSHGLGKEEKIRNGMGYPKRVKELIQRSSSVLGGRVPCACPYHWLGD